jgi:hypothetical protein
LTHAIGLLGDRVFLLSHLLGAQELAPRRFFFLGISRGLAQHARFFVRSSSTLRPISARSARPRRSSASSLRVWLATSPSSALALAATSQTVARA